MLTHFSVGNLGAGLQVFLTRYSTYSVFIALCWQFNCISARAVTVWTSNSIYLSWIYYWRTGTRCTVSMNLTTRELWTFCTFFLSVWQSLVQCFVSNLKCVSCDGTMVTWRAEDQHRRGIDYRYPTKGWLHLWFSRWAPCIAAVQLHATPVITCNHPFVYCDFRSACVFVSPS